MSTKLMKLLAVLFAFALIAAACGDDDDDSSSEEGASEEESSGREEAAEGAAANLEKTIAATGLSPNDLLATGGTMEAAIELVRKVGGTPIGAAGVIELGFLPGREKLGDVPAHALVTF